VTEDERELLDGPLTMQELRHAIYAGGGKKAPRRDGIGSAFYAETWEDLKDDWLELFAEMLSTGRLVDQQKLGVIVCTPKTKHPIEPKAYGPITLLNTDYKIIARTLAGRVRTVLGNILHPSQYCGTPDKSIFDAVATIRDAIAFAEISGKPLCVLSLDFKEAFDKVSHTYLWDTLRRYGFSEKFLELIRRLYTNAASVVQINGHISGEIPIGCSVRQGCPLSMALFFPCIDRLIRCLDENLQGLRMHRGKTNLIIVAYADDITIPVTTPRDIEVLEGII